MTVASADRLRTLPALLVGIVAGIALTAGAAMWTVDLVRGEAPTTAFGPPAYELVTAEAGVDHVYDGEFEYFVGGGVAVFDCNADDLPDMYFAGGVNPGRLYRNTSTSGIAFQAVDAPEVEVTGVAGAYPLDVDSDGIVDLAVLRVGENLMMRGLGDCRFEPANDLWGIDGGHGWTVSFSATWEPGQEWPTIVFADYIDLATIDDGRTCDGHVLYRPEGDGYGEPVPLEPGYCALSALFSDWDRSGRRDLRLTNDRHYYRDGSEQLWRIEPGTEPRLYTEADGWRPLQIWGMGIASHDLDGDAKPEVYLTSQGDNKLQTLAADASGPTYEDIALQSGANAHRPFAGDTTRPSTAWHAEFDDVNNDGFMDLFVTKGNVEAMPEFAAEDPNNLLLGQPDGAFVEAADRAGLLDMERSRGGALADLDLDGDLDVVVVERRQPVKIWEQTGEVGHWLGVTLSQEGPNRHAIGAWIELRIGRYRTEREVVVGGGHAGGQLGPTHFGLGDAERAEVRVHWPDGAVGDWQAFDADQYVTVSR
ncbi:MAG TPA: CRTAC1 family protein [Acidimicrobiia bacterium]|jgi:hypothetical protein